ncbi:TPA: YnjH family protein [Escherichia coli]|uniref:YnjH family protein n=1 Tax=Escherichia coli TaxID=562 RepID=UPI00165D1E54|nr:YnjH family protein [Escherichia coli]QNQ86469.1 YnjH family protein [Escherichia coli]HAL0469456.1 YnjH family protein [Escherichia coli]
MSRALIAVVLAFPLITLANPHYHLITLANPHYHPDVEVNVPPEVFSSGGQSAQPCTQCCVYQDQNYSEGAVIKAEGILLQCQRDDKTLSTNPLVWRRVKP